MSTPDVVGLGDVLAALRDWQRDDAPIQLHPGDLGWYWRFGAEVVAAALRTWSRNGVLLAVGFLDGPGVLRMTIAPEVWRDDAFARALLADVSDPHRGVLPSGPASVEVPDGTRLQGVMTERGFGHGDAWTPLRLDLGAPVPQTDVRTEVVTSAEQVRECTAVHRAAWGSAGFTDEHWHRMAAGPTFAEARCLLARDRTGSAVATVTAWGAGPGRPALVEPLGVHPDFRRRGHGAAICRAAAAALRDLGSSSMLVCTPSTLRSAVATYEAAGFRQLPDRLDLVRLAGG